MNFVEATMGQDITWPSEVTTENEITLSINPIVAEEVGLYEINFEACLAEYPQVCTNFDLVIEVQDFEAAETENV